MSYVIFKKSPYRIVDFNKKMGQLHWKNLNAPVEIGQLHFSGVLFHFLVVTSVGILGLHVYIYIYICMFI